MALSSAARSRWILAVILLACIVVAWSLRRPRPPQYSEAYVGDRAAVLWSTTAQVRQPVATLHYGERVAILRHTAEQSQVRTTDGIQGWVDNRLLMDPALWKKAASLLAGVKALPVQASGRTRALSNVHIEPGRDTPRIFQFGRNVPVVVFERRLTFAPHAAQSGAGEDAAGGEDTAKQGAEKSAADGDENKDDKKEDWLLVSRVIPQKTVVAAAASPAANSLPSAGTASPDAASAPAPQSGPSSGSATSKLPLSTPGGPVSAASPESADASEETPIAGWVLARFVELDPPDPIPDYSNAAGMHVVAWMVLNTVPDPGGDKPQYLVAGARAAEGQLCDFTLLRAYTWGVVRQRYETAFVEDNLCGRLPIRVRATPAGPEFNFAEADQPAVERLYRMRQTMIRRVTDSDASRRNLRPSLRPHIQRKPAAKPKPGAQSKLHAKTHIQARLGDRWTGDGLPAPHRTSAAGAFSGSLESSLAERHESGQPKRMAARDFT